MAFEQVIGQQRVKDVLSASVEKERIPHAYLFTGPEGAGMDAMALNMARGLLCSNNRAGGCGACPDCLKFRNLEHPAMKIILPAPSKPKGMKEDKYQDILLDRRRHWADNPYQKILYTPELSGMPAVGIDQIRSLKKEVFLKLTGGSFRVLLISDADRMTAAASNSLLKLLEEPPEGTVLFLTTSSSGRLLSTLVSRCQVIRFSPLAETQIEEALAGRWSIPPEKARAYSKMAAGSLQRALDFNEEAFDVHRNTALDFLEQILIPDELIRIHAARAVLGLRDKTVIADVFRLLHSLIRDWMMIQLDSVERIIHQDQTDRIRNLQAHYPNFKAMEALAAVSHAIDFIEKNVYLDLVVLNLSKDLQQCMS